LPDFRLTELFANHGISPYPSRNHLVNMHVTFAEIVLFRGV